MDASAPANEVLESALLRRSARVNATRGALCTPGRRPNATSPMSHLSVAMPRSECLAGGGAVYRGLRGEAVWEAACVGRSAECHNASICQAAPPRAPQLSAACRSTVIIELRVISLSSIRVLGIPGPSQGMLWFRDDEFFFVFKY